MARSLGTIGGGCVEAEVWAAAKDVLKAEAPRKMVFNLNNEASYDNGLICGGTLEVFVEPILPQPTLYIFGGGHVSMALAQPPHSKAGFDIGVIDDREQFANRERFPMAREVYTSFEDALREDQAECFELSGDRDARASRRHARAGLGREDRGALYRHDRQQAQSAFGLSRRWSAKASRRNFSNACMRPWDSTSARSLPKRSPSALPPN